MFTSPHTQSPNAYQMASTALALHTNFGARILTEPKMPGAFELDARLSPPRKLLLMMIYFYAGLCILPQLLRQSGYIMVRILRQIYRH